MLFKHADDMHTRVNERLDDPVVQDRFKLVTGEQKRQFPCSPGQRRFWWLHQLNPRNPSLNISRRWRIEGTISNAELERAFQIVIARHQILRTSFAEAGGEVVQIIEGAASFHIPVMDLTGLPEAEALTEADRAASLEASAPFELSVPSLIRVTQVRLRDNLSDLLVTLHHIVCDSWSMRILLHETGAICAALHARLQPTLPDLPMEYAAFATRRAACFATLSQQTELDFWKRTLHSFKHFEIQPDRVRPAVLTSNRNTLSAPLDSALTNELLQLGHSNGATLHITVLTALLSLLHRYTGETDIAIGSQLLGRDEVELNSLIGLFSNTLVVRGDLSGDPSFVALLARIRDNVTEISGHQDVSTETLIEIVKPKPDPSRNPLYSVNFVFQPSYIHLPYVTNFQLTELPTCFTGTPCDLTISVSEGPTGWRISCEFNLDLFDRQTIIQLLSHFETLLRGIVADPAAKISGLPILSSIERHELIAANNRTRAPYPEHLTVPQLFEAQARRTPDAPAIVCGDRSMSYRDLDIASNKLARELRVRGVDPASRVAVFLDRSPELMVAILAVLKSGSAYVPLDSTYPMERLQYVFENSRPAAIITRASLRERLVRESIAVVEVDSQSSLIEEQSAEPLAVVALPDDPAYIIYTSGSTGRPKGVAIHHRALVNLLYAIQRQPGLTAADTVVSVTTISFDIAMLDLFLPLVVGAKLILAKEQEATDGAALLRLLQRHNATLMQATPVTWQLLLEAGWHGHPSLKMLCGGEALPRKLAERLLEYGGELWNMYGPTETTVWSSAQRVASGEGPVPIGPPIANTQFYVLDARQELVPIGVPGELFIGGDGVGLGYFDLPEVTGQKFLPDKFRDLPGAKLYRTGDIVRMKQDGGMEYLGRTDHQIKLRGFRIELGEIEAALMRCPGIEEAVVVLGQDASGESAIWAYVVPQRAEMRRSDALINASRVSLGQFLPSYMNPSSIVVLEALPRTLNGKIDRRNLPPPPPVQRRVEVAMQPLNEIERRLARIWSSVLGMELTDKTADFFAVGGHSLLAARLLARIEAEFGRRMSLLTLFKAPCIEEQAKLLMDSDQREYDFRQVVQLQPNGSKSPLIAIHNTGVYYYNLSKHLGADQPLTALQLFDPSIARDSLPASLQEIAAEYVRLIHKLQATGPYKLIGWCLAGVLAFEVARQLDEGGDEVSLLALIDAWAPGHNRRLPRLRAILSDYSYRWQLIGADWQRVLSGEKNLTAFVAQRALSQKLMRWLSFSRTKPPARVDFENRELSAEDYDHWLFTYLEKTAEMYEPAPYAGKVTLLCSAQEPRGLFLDPKMGWGPFASRGVEVAVIDGDHFTMFKGQGLEQMATQIAAVSEIQGSKGPGLGMGT